MNKLHTSTGVAAIVLAAGMSRRMGQPKMVLPWGDTTVVGRVLDVLIAAEIDKIFVVTGGNREEVNKAIVGKYTSNKVHIVFNPDYENGEMLRSIQVGLSALGEGVDAALIVLGDQPQVQMEVVSAVQEAYRTSNSKIVVPSYQMHRGHPWIIRRDGWDDIIRLQPPITLREYLLCNSESIHYLPVDTPSILHDLDTPEDYQNHKP